MKTSETQTESSKCNHSFAQTEPTIPKIYNDTEVQTETIDEPETQGDFIDFENADIIYLQKKFQRFRNQYRRNIAVEIFKMSLSNITKQNLSMIPKNLIPSFHQKSCEIF